MEKRDGRVVARDNDLRLLRALHRFGWLRTRDLAALVWQRWAAKPHAGRPSLQPPMFTPSGLRMAQRTLRRLLQGRLVLQARGPDGSLTFSLAEGGARLLQAHGVKAVTGKDLMRSFSTSHFRHRCISNEVAIGAIVEGFRVATEREISRGLWLGGEQGIAGKRPDVFIRGASAWWIEVERSRKNSKDYSALQRFLTAAVRDAFQTSGSILLGGEIQWGKVMFVCRPTFKVKLCRDLRAKGWTDKTIETFISFETLLYEFKDINFS
jgi:hypothetical protein